MNENFYVIVKMNRETGSLIQHFKTSLEFPPSVYHSNYDAVCEEAIKLARQNPNDKFVILGTVSVIHVIPPEPPELKVNIRAPRY